MSSISRRRSACTSSDAVRRWWAWSWTPRAGTRSPTGTRRGRPPSRSGCWRASRSASRGATAGGAGAGGAPRAGGAREAPFAVRLLAGFQERIARDYGGQVGDEMLSAAGAAREVGARLALIDQDSRLLLPRLWKSLPFEERVKAAVAVLTGLFVRKKSVERELKRYETDQKAYLDEFSQQFPTIRRILIDEREDRKST